MVLRYYVRLCIERKIKIFITLLSHILVTLSDTSFIKEDVYSFGFLPSLDKEKNN